MRILRDSEHSQKQACRLRLIFALAGLSAIGCVAQTATPRYTVVDRGPVLVRTMINTPGLNSHVDVAIWRTLSSRETQGVVFRGDRPESFSGRPDFSLVYPADVSDDGAVVGLLQVPQDMRFTRAFLWREGNITSLSTLGGMYDVASAMNRAGEIAGSAQTGRGELHAVLWRANQPLDLGTLDRGDYSDARDINDAGSVVGEANTVANGKPRAFYWRDGKMKELASAPGGTLCSAQAINNKEEIAGSCDLSNGTSHGFLWRGNKLTDLGSLGKDDDLPSTALDINVHTQVVGSSEIADGKQRAFLWEHGRMINLNRCIPPGSGWLLLVGSRINDAGEILGRGYYKGAIHAFLLIPQADRQNRPRS